jgi:hypothetical protein
MLTIVSIEGQCKKVFVVWNKVKLRRPNLSSVVGTAWLGFTPDPLLTDNGNPSNSHIL